MFLSASVLFQILENKMVKQGGVMRGVFLKKCFLRGGAPWPTQLPPALSFFHRFPSIWLLVGVSIHQRSTLDWAKVIEFSTLGSNPVWGWFLNIFYIFRGWFSHFKFSIFLDRISLKLMVKSQTNKNFIKFCPQDAILFFLFRRQTLTQSLFLSYTPVFKCFSNFFWSFH